MDTRMQGKVCLLTGATSGIGKATALGLAQLGASVLLVGRNQEKGVAVLQEIEAETGNPNLTFLLADLSSQASIRQLVDEVKRRFLRLDILINNAGLLMFKRETTEDGLEMTFAVNHLAPFLLTHLLLDLLKASAPSRIIQVCSDSHERATISLDDLQGEKKYSPWHAYGQSKLAMLLCTYELSRHLAGTNVTVNALHPGFVATSIAQDSLSEPLRVLANLLLPLVGLSPEAGARTSLYLASSPDLTTISGKYFVKSVPIRSAPLSYDEVLQKEVWEASEQLIARSAPLSEPA